MNTFSIPLEKIRDEENIQWLQLLGEGISTKSLHLLNMLFGTSYTSTSVNVGAEVDSVTNELVFKFRSNKGWYSTKPKGDLTRKGKNTKSKSREKEDMYKKMYSDMKKFDRVSIENFYSTFASAYKKYNNKISENRRETLSKLMAINKEENNETKKEDCKQFAREG